MECSLTILLSLIYADIIENAIEGMYHSGMLLLSIFRVIGLQVSRQLLLVSNASAPKANATAWLFPDHLSVRFHVRNDWTDMPAIASRQWFERCRLARLDRLGVTLTL